MYKWTVLCIFFFGFFLQAQATIVIKGINGTKSAQLGTNDTIISCDYDYQNESGVEVKWFVNDSVQIFTWVPEYNKPQAMGPFSSILDVNNNSIRFKEMTKNLTGYYTCKVSSNDNETMETQVMVVYQPPKLAEFFPEETSETLICSAYEVYPRPIITIFQNVSADSNQTIALTEEREDLFDTDDELYNITKTIKFDIKSIVGSAQFVCIVVIPDTDFNKTMILTYEKIGNESTTTEYPDEYTTISTETLVTYSNRNSTNNYSTVNNSTTQGGFGVPTAEVSKWLMLLTLAILMISSKQ